MKVIILIVLIVYFAFQPFSGNAQLNSIAFEHISIDEGLSQNSVYATYKDSKGYLWFGTAEGLNRYDGFKFTVFKGDLFDITPISDSWVTCIYEDKFENLWIGTQDGGLNLFNYENETFTCYKNLPENQNTLSNNTINAICEDNHGILWIATNNGLNKLELKNLESFSPDNQPFIRFEKESHPSLTNNEILTLCYTDNGELWLGTYGGGFLQMKENTDGSNIFIPFQTDSNILNPDSFNEVWSIFQDNANKDNLWILYSEDIEKFNRVTQQFTKFKKDQNIASSFIELRTAIMDKKGNIWIGAKDHGLFMFDSGTQEFFQYQHSNYDITTISKDNILSIYEDNEGILWIGTKGGGINKKRDYRFLHYKNIYNDSKSLVGTDVWAIFKDKSGLLWVATDVGLNKINRQTNEIELIGNSENKHESLSDNHVYCFYEDTDGEFWIGTSTGGLNRLDRKTGVVKHYMHEPKNNHSISDNFVRTIIEDPKGYFWIGTSKGLNKFDKRTGTFKSYKNIPNDNQSLSHNRINSLVLDKNGILWIATSGGGLNKFDTKTEKFSSYKNDPANPNSINDIYIMSILEDKNGKLWLGAYSGGLSYFDKEKETFKHFTEKDGLANNVVYGILEDNEDNLWLSTNKGLSKFNTKQELFHNYDKTDGLQDNEFNRGACFKSADGEMFFGGINGFNSFFPDEITSNVFSPPVVFTELKIINETIKFGEDSPINKAINTCDEITLSYQDYIFSLEFSALSYSSPKKNKYKYMLKGFDNDWITTDHQNRLATYTNLDGGTYTLLVKASNNDGVWNETATSLKITIEPPYWETWWFITIMIIFIILAIIGFYLWRVSTLKNQKAKLEHIVKLQTSEVVKQKEDLLTINEELTATNEELSNQREELESTLQSLKDAQSKLIQSEKMASLGLIAGGIAHEINNPLNFIHGGITGIEEYFKENPAREESNVNFFINVIGEGVKRAVDIVSSLNHFTRSNDQITERVDIHVVINNCFLMLQNATKDRIEIIKNYTDKPFTLVGNEGKMHQAILNILSNSVQAIPEKGIITINTEIEKDHIKISVYDTGHGISEENLPKIMEPFFTTKEPGKGTGLGLSITYNILKEHKGTIVFDSVLGKGTSTIITLPVNATELKQ